MLIIKNGKLFTKDRGFIENISIIIKDNKIFKLNKESDKLNRELMENSDINTIDATGRYILPGLIDSHCHIGLWEDGVGIEGEDGNEMTDPITPELMAVDGIYHLDRAFEEARESGVTTVVAGPGSGNVISGQFVALKTFGNRIEDMIIKNPVAMKVAFGENPKNIYGSKKQSPMTRMSIAALLREAIHKAIQYKEDIEMNKKDPQNNKKPEFNMKMEAMLKVLNKEIPLKAHAHRADDILTAIRIAKEFGLELTLEHCTEGYLIKDILAKEGIKVIVGPLLTDRSKIELRNQSLKNPAILSKEGVEVSIMTDHPCVPIQHLLLCAALAAKEGMDEVEAIKAITINAAISCGIDNRVGSIEEGKDADIIIFDGHPFDLRSKVINTIIDGKIIYEGKEYENN